MTPLCSNSSDELAIAPNAPRFLVVDDNEVDSLNCQCFLKQIFAANSNIDTAMNWENAVAAVEAQAHDVYIVDQNLGGHIRMTSGRLYASFAVSGTATR